MGPKALSRRQIYAKHGVCNLACQEKLLSWVYDQCGPSPCIALPPMPGLNVGSKVSSVTSNHLKICSNLCESFNSALGLETCYKSEHTSWTAPELRSKHYQMTHACKMCFSKSWNAKFMSPKLGKLYLVCLFGCLPNRFVSQDLLYLVSPVSPHSWVQECSKSDSRKCKQRVTWSCSRGSCGAFCLRAHWGLLWTLAVRTQTRQGSQSWPE